MVQAPIVEEVGKGLGLLLLFVTARRAFDGPVDGVVYGALIGAGFALTENIQYFAISSSRAARPTSARRSSCAASSRRSRT